MKKEAINLFLVLIAVCTLCWVSYRIGKTTQDKSDMEILLQQKVTLLDLKNKQDSEKFKFTTDSMQIYYSGIDKANQRTNNSINKILKQNDKNKADLLVVTDSVRMYIIDSLFRAAGIR